MTRNATMRSPSRRPISLVIGSLAIAAVLGGGYGLWYIFLRPAEPAAVGDSPASVPSTLPGSTAPLTGGIGGTWNVDTTLGSFSDFSDSFVGYRVQEQLASIGGNTAVGRTPKVSGTMTIDGTKVTAATIEADLTALKSNDDRRDGQLSHQGIETSTFPTATFTLSSPIDLGSVPADGTPISVTASGKLTLHGLTQDVQIPLTATLSGSTVLVTGKLDIAFSDYGIQKPTSFAVLSIADTGTIELHVLFTKAA